MNRIIQIAAVGQILFGIAEDGWLYKYDQEKEKWIPEAPSPVDTI
jgi:hypothetical protein